MRKEEADAHRKAEDEAKKKIALSSMGSGYSSVLQRVPENFFFLNPQSNNQLLVWPLTLSVSPPGRGKERQEADREGEEEEDHGGEVQTAQHRQLE